MKACPFCGAGEDQICPQYNGNGDEWIQCICGASGPTGKDFTALWDSRPSPWVSVDIKPPNNQWVLGSCRMTADNLKDHPPYIFQVKYEERCGWSGWCGDLEIDSEWKVLKWMPLP